MAQEEYESLPTQDAMQRAEFVAALQGAWQTLGQTPVQGLLLIFEQEDLVYGLTEEALIEAAANVLRVALVNDLEEVGQLEIAQDG